MMRTLLLLLWGMTVGTVMGDGISMTKDHRFTHKRESCYTMKLTADQIAWLESKRDGEKKLYADMKLTDEQSAFLMKKTGKEVTEVLVFEKGWNDCGCCAQNIASRFVPDQIEVSNSYLVDERVLRQREEKQKAAEAERAAMRAENKRS